MTTTAVRKFLRPAETSVEVKPPPVINDNGYIVIDGQLQHRKVWAEHYGPIPTGFIVHHCDGNKLYNDIGNLVALPSLYHERMHEECKKRTGSTVKGLPDRGVLLVYYQYAIRELQLLKDGYEDSRSRYRAECEALNRRWSTLGMPPTKKQVKASQKPEKKKKKKPRKLDRRQWKEKRRYP